jgi:UDP-glucose 4-epimerase
LKASTQQNVLVTGGAGFIGSHTCVELLRAGCNITVLDNFCNSRPEAIKRIETISGKVVPVFKGDVRETAFVESVLRESACEAVIHFAGLKAVGESVDNPLLYYDANVGGSLSLLRAMESAGVKKLVFSSSATVYGEPQELPYRENHPLAPTNPYGRTKRQIEDMLRDLHASNADWRIAILRYFNPVGAHESGLIGEDPLGIPNNLMPYVAQVAIGRREKLNIWGADYKTPDGTGVRDYIHVVDLAQGHVCALDRLQRPGCITVNLGTGQGYSVLDLVRAFETASGCKVPYLIEARRAGDIASSYADPSLAKAELGWVAERDLMAMCRDVWRWQINNPEGFGAES